MRNRNALQSWFLPYVEHAERYVREHISESEEIQVLTIQISELRKAAGSMAGVSLLAEMSVTGELQRRLGKLYEVDWPVWSWELKVTKFPSENVKHYGLNGDTVAAFIERAKRLKPGEKRRLAEAVEAWGDAVIDPAWDAVADADPSVPCGRAAQYAEYAVMDSGYSKYDQGASVAASCAVLAIWAKGLGLISQGMSDSLSGPWRSVIFDTEDLFAIEDQPTS